MKKKPEETTSIFKKKGFYAALYSCAGIILVSAAVVTYYNNNAAGKGIPNEIAQQTEEPETALTSQSNVSSYLASATPTPRPVSTPRPTSAPVSQAVPAPDTSTEEAALTTNESVTNESVTTDSASSDSSTDSATELAVASVDTVATLSPATSETVEVGTEDEKVVYAEPIVENPTDDKVISSSQNQELITAIVNTEREETQAVFNMFGSGQTMSWPLEGAIVMDYSTERTIYDPTLEHYRTNASIYIEAPVGTQVKSSADGVVTEIYSSREKGNVVVVDHGNGWLSKYSQLQDTLLVEVGDVISEGQLIGGVSVPSNHSILQGNHLEFAITKDNEPTDPKNVLK